MLGAVVLEHAADVLHARDAADVGEEDREAQEALHEVEEYGIVRDEMEELRRTRRDGDEEDAREHEREDDRARHLLVRELLVLVARHLRRVGERAQAEHEGLDERDGAAEHRFFENRIAVGNRADGMRLDLDAAVWVAHRCRDVLRPAHHHALDDGLSAHTEFCHRKAPS